jgi:ankyrin repeat protein
MSWTRWLRGAGTAAAGAIALAAWLQAAGPAPVADAASQGDAAAMRALLKQGADVNAAQGDGMTALHWAASRNDPAMAEMLIYAGANVRATTRLGGYTPLHLAARYGHAEVMTPLVAAGADVNAPTATGATPLMLAAAAGSVQAVELLADRGADVNARERARGQTALMFAAANGRADVVSALLARGADVAATTKVDDLTKWVSPEEEFLRRQRQQQAPRGGEPVAAEPGTPGAQVKDGTGGGATAEKPGSGAAAEGATQAAGARDGRSAGDARAAQKAGGSRAAEAEAAGASPAGVAAPKAQAGAAAAGAGPQEPAGGPATPRDPRAGRPGIDRQYRYNELVGSHGGLTALLYAARQGHVAAVEALLAGGADIDQVSAGDGTSPLLMAIINGHFDLAKILLDRGANPKLASENGVTPLYAVLNVQWAPKALYPQPRAYLQQRLTHLDLMKALLDKGADPNVRLKKKVWYSGYNFDLSGVDEIGATPFWRAAYAADVDAMRLLVSYGADPHIPTMKPAGRPRTGDGGREQVQDVSGLPPVPVGGPAVTPLQAAAGVGYGEGFAANSHRYAPGGPMPAVKYLVEELGADVNAVDHEGNTALHHAAARGDNEMILYLVSKGADVTKVNRAGQTTADMANGPVQRIQPFPETVALLVKLGAKNNNKCVSC